MRRLSISARIPTHGPPCKRPAQRGWELHSGRFSQVRLHRLAESFGNLFAIRWVVDAWDGFRGNQMVQLRCHLLELLLQLNFVLTTFACDFLLILLVQEVSHAIATGHNGTQIRLAGVKIVQVLSAPESTECLLDCSRTVVKKLHVPESCSVAQHRSRRHTPKTTSGTSLDHPGGAGHFVESPANHRRPEGGLDPHHSSCLTVPCIVGLLGSIKKLLVELIATHEDLIVVHGPPGTEPGQARRAAARCFSG
mmetsp:Transcript_78063/g.208694  ORF Transcript_78063/g.208694 Transcript_78063/m.208694 type:complete len:251 (-) Transcript_78063:15-767(-)